MSLYGDMNTRHKNSDQIWKALADATRREILDFLAERPRGTGEVVAKFDGKLCRTAVMKHLSILADANLVLIRREGRNRWNYLNPAPIQEVCDRWVSRHVKQVASSMAKLKELVEERESTKPTKKISRKPTTRTPKAN